MPSKIQVCLFCSGLGWITKQCLRSFLRRVVTAGWCIRCHWEKQWCRVCPGHTSHWRCCALSPACGALDWVSPQDDGSQRNTAALQDSGALDDGGLWLLMGCQQGQRKAQSPSLLESEPGMTVGLGSTHNSLLSRSIHQDNLCTEFKERRKIYINHKTDLWLI